ncbi:cytochrome c biogenesis protein CcsA [candidate division WOR-3 bacterium]|nr:cytochrome c biogenesis protein CcsA [candidate division WOR-3 bacterium]
MISPLTAYNLEKLLLTILCTFYGLAILFYCPPKVKFKQKLKLVGFALHLLAFLAHLFLLYIRVVSTGRAPFTGVYESLIFLSVSITFVFLASFWRNGAFGFGRGAAFASWVVIFSAFMLRIFAPHTLTAPRYLPPVLNSIYFVLHVIPAFLAYGCFTMGFFAAITSLGTEVELKAKRRSLAEFYLWPGMILFTVSLGLGSAYSRLAWGQWWIPDLKFTFSLVTWVIFLLALLLRHGKGQGRKGFPWLVIAGFALMVFTFLGTNKGLHDFF